MSETTPEPADSADSADSTDATDATDAATGGDDVAEPAAMKLDSAEVDHIELSQDGGETFERKSDEEHFG